MCVCPSINKINIFLAQAPTKTLLHLNVTTAAMHANHALTRRSRFAIRASVASRTLLLAYCPPASAHRRAITMRGQQL